MRVSPYGYGFWYEYCLDPERWDYNVIFDQTVPGLKVERLRRAVDLFVKDHILLNSHLVEINAVLYWEKNTSIEPLEVLSNACHETVHGFIQRPFKLDVGPLYRFGIIKLSPTKCRLIIVLHHVLTDGRRSSRCELISTLSKYYQKQYSQCSI
ncbi:MAG: condensation domain-containing protein [Legionellaceae bacterium]|nr:condensation domain-containing protein [Legionellaceae bacterium]